MPLSDPIARSTATAAAVDVGVLVFREGLECVLVLTAITASMVGSTRAYRRPVAAGAALAFLATLLTWSIAVAIYFGTRDGFAARAAALQQRLDAAIHETPVAAVADGCGFDRLTVPHHRKQREHAVMGEVDVIDLGAGLINDVALRR